MICHSRGQKSDALIDSFLGVLAPNIVPLVGASLTMPAL